MPERETVAPNIDELLRAAIKQKHLIELVYLGKRRIVAPHDYGVHNGVIKLLGYQVGGSSSGRRLLVGIVLRRFRLRLRPPRFG